MSPRCRLGLWGALSVGAHAILFAVSPSLRLPASTDPIPLEVGLVALPFAAKPSQAAAGAMPPGHAAPRPRATPVRTQPRPPPVSVAAAEPPRAALREREATPPPPATEQAAVLLPEAPPPPPPLTAAAAPAIAPVVPAALPLPPTAALPGEEASGRPPPAPAAAPTPTAEPGSRAGTPQQGTGAAETEGQGIPRGDPGVRGAGTSRQAAPAYAENPPPPYPRVARRQGLEGEVWLRVRVSTSGGVLGIELWRSSGHPPLDRAAVGAVRSWRFRPAQVGDLPVEGEVLVPVRFQLAQANET